MLPKNLLPRKIVLVLCTAIFMTSLFGFQAQAKTHLSPAPMMVKSPDAPDLLHDTVGDFDQVCATLTNTHVSDVNGGEVELAGNFADQFGGTTLDGSRWFYDSWDGSVYSPVVTDGKLILPPHGFVRSNTALFTHGILEGKVEFTPGPYQHIGFASSDFVNNNKFLFFSTYNTEGITSSLYARVGLYDVFANSLISPLPSGIHRYRLEWLAANATQDQVNFYLDGILVYSSDPFSNTILSDLSVFMSNDSALNLTLDEIQAGPPYATSGSYISCPLNAGAGLAWQTASWAATLPAGTNLVVQTQTSSDGTTWSGWSTVPTSGANIASPNQYIQYQLQFSSTDPNVKPALNSINLTTGPGSADLELTKAPSNAAPNVGDVETFTVTVTNKGPFQATGVKAKDVLQTGYQYTGETHSQGSYDQANGEWTIGTLAVDQSVTLQLSGTVKASGIYSNYAQVIASDQPDLDSTPNDNSTTQDDDDTVTVEPIPVADLSVVKTVSTNTPLMGNQVVFTITVSNAGPSDASGVTVKDVLPSGYTFVESSQPVNYDSVSGIWNIGTINAGQNASLQVTATVNATGLYNNRAEVWTSNAYDPDSTPGTGADEDDDDTVVVTPVQAADLSILKQAQIDSLPLYVGNTVIFNVTVANEGPNSAQGVVVKDLVPSGYEYVSVTTTQGSYVPQTGLWDVGTLPANENALLSITVTVKPSGDYTNIGEVWQSQVQDPDSTPGNGVTTEDDYGVVTLNPLPAADVSIVKTLETLSPTPGSNVTFAIHVTNSGPSSAGGVTIRDVIPVDHTYISSDHAVVNNSGVLTWDLGTIQANQEIVILLTLRADKAGTYTNQVQIWTSDTHDPDSTPGNSIENEDDMSIVGYIVKYYLFLPLIQKNP